MIGLILHRDDPSFWDVYAVHLLVIVPTLSYLGFGLILTRRMRCWISAWCFDTPYRQDIPTLAVLAWVAFWPLVLVVAGLAQFVYWLMRD